MKALTNNIVIRYHRHIEEALKALDLPITPLYQAMQWLLQSEGKRIRPLLMLLSYQAVGGTSPHRVMYQALALELFHTFTLVHDDIMDQSPLRRGQPTVHIQFGLPTAILAGDALHVLAHQYLVKNVSDTDLAIALVDSFNEMAVLICEGQQEDMEFEKIFPSVNAYLQMIYKKTACLLGVSLKIGALLGRCSIPKRISLLEEFGVNLGLAYQIQDDYLDFYGAETGKQIGGDILAQKRNLLTLLTAEQLGSSVVEEGFAIVDVQEKLNYFKKIFEQVEIEEQVLGYIKQYQRKALFALKAIKGNTRYLEEVFVQLTERKR